MKNLVVLLGIGTLLSVPALANDSSSARKHSRHNSQYGVTTGTSSETGTGTTGSMGGSASDQSGTNMGGSDSSGYDTSGTGGSTSSGSSGTSGSTPANP